MTFTLNPDMVVARKDVTSVAGVFKLIEDSKGAVEEISGNAWNDVVVGVLLDGPDNFFPAIETAYKNAYSATRMPGAYRSAKSVATKALEHRIELITAEGYPRGKTEIQKALAELKAEKTAFAKAEEAVDKFRKVAGELTSAELDIIKGQLAELLK